MRRFIVSVFLLSLIAIPINAISAQRNVRIVAKFGGECTGVSLQPSARLQRLILKSSRRNSFHAQLPDGYKSFPWDLNGDGNAEHFIRLSCGGTGNCT